MSNGPGASPEAADWRREDIGMRADPDALLPLAIAKTVPPQPLRAGVDRRRLFNLLDAAARKPVTLVCAGAGWGKTMLVSAWAETRAAPVAWLSLDRYDNDPQLFWAYVLAALRVAGAIAPDNPLAEMGSVPVDERERAHRLTDGFEHLPQQTVLVLDDFHEVDDPQILREMNDLLRYPPAPLRVVLISRSWPSLALHRLRTAEQVAEIRAEDLAFTGDEAAALIRGRGLDLGQEDVSILLDRTEGWATGLHLGAGFLAGEAGIRSLEDFAGDVRVVIDYLTDEVLAGRSDQQRLFLLQTSICERVCADLADAVTAQRDAQRTLEQLEHDNDFVVRLGAKPVWFRYHHLLREALGHRLSLEAPSAVTGLHRRAARWYARNNSVMEALTHAISARDWSYVGRVVATRAAPLILSEHRGALVKILQQVPPEKMTSSPELVFCAALLLFHAGDFEAIPARISRARDLLRRRRDVAARRPVEIMLFTLALSTDRAVGDMPAIIAGCSNLLDLLATDDSGDGVVAAQHRAIAMNNRGLALLWTGQPEAAARELWAAASAARAVGLELAEINATGHLALLHIMCGSAHEASQLAAAARDLAERRGWMYALQTVPAHLAQALVHLERHDLDSAEEALRQGARAHNSNREDAQRLVLLGVEARLAAAHGELVRARLFLAEAGRDRSPRLHAPTLDRWLSLINAEVDLAAGLPAFPENGESGLVPDHAVDFPRQIIRARSAFAARDLRRAGELLAGNPTTLPQTVATVEAGILGALVADARGQATRAVDLLADAVTLGAREGIRRPFFTLSSRRLDDIFYRLQLLGGAAPFVQEAIGETRATRKLPAEIATVQGLSDRELEVLRYLPTMLTAAEIAADLGVSVNTIKVHMQSIYRKLGVNRRGNAVAEARDNGIL